MANWQRKYDTVDCAGMTNPKRNDELANALLQRLNDRIVLNILWIKEREEWLVISVKRAS